MKLSSKPLMERKFARNNEGPSDPVVDLTELEIDPIRGWAFESCPITKVVLPEGLESIFDRAFYNSGVKEVLFPASLSEIGEEAFIYAQLEGLDLRHTQMISAEKFVHNLYNTFGFNLALEICYDPKQNSGGAAAQDFADVFTQATLKTISSSHSRR
jgi:hypothetical protein